MADSSRPSNPSRSKLSIHSIREDRRRKRKKCLLAICAIWKNNPHGQGRSFVGTGSLVKDFYKDCDKKIHLITSREVISSKDISGYSLCFKKSKKRDKRRRELSSIGNSAKFISHGLAVVAVDPDKFSFIRRRTSGLLTYRPFTICGEENEGNSKLTVTFLREMKSHLQKAHIQLQKTLAWIKKALELQLSSQAKTARQKPLVSLPVTTTCRFLMYCFHRLIGHGYVQVGNFLFVKHTCKCFVGQFC